MKRLIVAAVMAVGLSLAIATVADAAYLDYCGGPFAWLYAGCW